MTAIRGRIQKLESDRAPEGGDGCPECGGLVFMVRITASETGAPVSFVRNCVRCRWSESGDGPGPAPPGQTTVRLPKRAESAEAWERSASQSKG